ncbi:DUF262 domain-containing protein [Thiothrix subterranea]|uniref:DUF262 domain-containing HNH endonuclease family protein n=1 Tax=Thiothrix subterranea TaxID=2735563 RepID=UPI00192B32E1|nr:DUF262 domain-containing HNH endonuclease family protein [Thiothrix subterranea]QQZ28834.1 DUF262 domain-containing protein [Thiothrix subterranea]
MPKVSDTFTSEALSIQDTFLLHNSNVGYRIPIYQRGYRWNDENIFRLFESILHGIILLEEDSSIRFIGTIILSNDKEKKEKEFGGISLSIVDGQQRLSTIALIICRLMNKIMLESNELNLQEEDDLSQDIYSLLDSLRSCIVGRKNSTRIKDYLSEFYPRLVRESVDTRAHNASSKKYESFIAEYLFNFGKHYYDFTQGDFEYNDFVFHSFSTMSESEDQVFLKKSIKHIDKFIDRISKGEALTDDSDEEIFPSRVKFFNNDNYIKILEGNGLYVDKENFNKLSDGLARVIFFSSYLLNNISLTCVQVEDDKYVFDIFDALNTTGEPLTAIETFKPEVIKFIEDRKHITGDFSNSRSRLFFDEIDQCLSSKAEISKSQKDIRQVETKEIITSFALYIGGDTQNYDLGGQRRYLRSKYSLIHSDNELYEKKEYFVKSLKDIAFYRRIFWEEHSLANALPEILDYPERQKILLCLNFIKDMNTTLAIPILARYYFASEQSKCWSDFIKVVKSVTAFLVIRRAATGSTAGIDSDFRNLMKKGHKKIASKPLKLGLLSNNELASPAELNQYLLSYIDSPKLGTNQDKVLNKESWTNKVINQPLYDKSKALCKFLLIVAAHNSVEGKVKKHILTKEGRDNCNFLELSKWRDPLHKTVEHIAPQNGRGIWRDELYNDIDTVHTIGNLILLPELENAIIGNKPWLQKKLFFTAFSQEDKKEIAGIIEKAKNSPYPLSKAAIRAIEDGKFMPLISSITDIEDWNIEIVTERGRNICHLAWHELSQWLEINE